MNDYELLYLIEEGNEHAMDMMVDKYLPLIHAVIHRFNIYQSQREDFYQEGCLVLLNSIHKYDCKYQKTFTRFFEMMLVRKFINILNKQNKPLTYLEEMSFDRFFVEEEASVYCSEKDIEDAKELLNDFEFQIFEEHYVRNRSLKELSIEWNIPIKRVYNAVYRLKEKLKEQFDVA